MTTNFFASVNLFFTLTIWTYGVFAMFVDLYGSYFPLGMFPPFVAVVLLQYFHVPPPPREKVEALIGRDIRDESNSDNNLVKMVAHRGAGLDAPENSLIAFRQCKERGCNFVEFDVSLTKDAVPIVFHDANTERVAGSTLAIGEHTWHELSSIDIATKHPFSERYQGTHIPTLDDVVALLLELKMKMFIDLKNCDTRLVKVILDLFARFPTLVDNAIVTTFYPHLIFLIRRARPQIVCSMAFRPNFFTHRSYDARNGGANNRVFRAWYKHVPASLLNSLYNWTFRIFIYKFVGLSIVLLHKDCVSPEKVQEWRDRNIRVCLWTVNHPLEKQYASRVLKCTYMTDTLVAEATAHANS